MTEQEHQILCVAFDKIFEGLDLIRSNFITPADIRQREINVREALMTVIAENERLKAKHEKTNPLYWDGMPKRREDTDEK